MAAPWGAITLQSCHSSSTTTGSCARFLATTFLTIAFGDREAPATTNTARALCHGLSRLAATGGRLLQPGDAEAEPLEAGGIHRAIAFSAASAPDLRAGALVSP